MRRFSFCRDEPDTDDWYWEQLLEEHGSEEEVIKYLEKLEEEKYE